MNFAKCKNFKIVAYKIMGGEEINRNYNEAKKTIKYLKKRYGKFRHFSHGKQKEIQKSIILDHDKSDLNRMFRKDKTSEKIVIESHEI